MNVQERPRAVPLQLCRAERFAQSCGKTRRKSFPPSAGVSPVVLGTQNACGVLPLSPREERVGRESERGEIDKRRLLSPALSSFLRRIENAVARSKQFFRRTQLTFCPSALLRKYTINQLRPLFSFRPLFQPVPCVANGLKGLFHALVFWPQGRCLNISRLWYAGPSTCAFRPFPLSKSSQRLDGLRGSV